MDVVQNWIGSSHKRIVKLSLLLLLSYSFLGISEGTFFWFENGTDAALNFLFTTSCVSANWVLFKKLFQIFQKKRLGPLHQPIQYLSIILLLLGTTTVLNWFYIEILWNESLSETQYFSTVFPLAIILFASWVLGYSWLHQFNTKPQKQKKEEMRIEVKKGQKTVLIELESIMGFSLENSVVFVVTSNEERFIMDKNLTTLENEMIDFEFFRVNRQLLVQKSAIEAYQTINNEKIRISLNAAFNKSSSHIISRYKAPAFRKWINSTPTI